MIVVDSNVLAYLMLPNPFTSATEELFESDPEWAAPVLWRSEFRNILAGYLRNGKIEYRQLVVIQSEAESLMADREYQVDSTSVLELVRDTRCSAYDCEFAALAKHLGVRLVTMDRKLLRAFPNTAIPLPGCQPFNPSST